MYHRISCDLLGKEVHWTVNDKNEIIGTTDINEASPFFIKSTGSPVHTKEFYIQHYKHGRRFFVLCNGDLFGKCAGPLKMARHIVYHHAHFVLHSQERRKVLTCGVLKFPCTTAPCTYDPCPLDDWITGGEYFYINCSRRRFKINGYLAMERFRVAQSNQTPDSQYRYRLIGVGDPDNASVQDISSLFHLNKFSPLAEQKNIDQVPSIQVKTL